MQMFVWVKIFTSCVALTFKINRPVNIEVHNLVKREYFAILLSAWDGIFDFV